MTLRIAAVSLLTLIATSNNAWAYGSSSSAKACAKPKFSGFVPADRTEVKAGAEFAFIASANTYPESIKVTFKDAPLAVNIADKSGATIKVSGKLPATATDGFARISISGESANRCKGNDGWLVKLTP